MKKIIKIENNFNNNELRIEWLVGNLCNRKCWYCFPGANTGDQSFPKDIELLKKNFSALFKQYELIGRTKIDFLFTGGEPTLWKELPEIIKYLKDNHNIFIRILTNGSKKLKWWEENKDIFDQVEISVHNEELDINHIINVCDYLYESKKMIVANVLIDPKNFEKCVQIIEDLKHSSHPWPIIAKTVFFDGIPDYTNKQKEYFTNTRHRLPGKVILEEVYSAKSKGTQYQITYNNGEIFKLPHDRWIALEGLNHFYGWKCNIGVESIQITLDGRLTGNCLQTLYEDGNFYSILDKDFAEKFNPRIESIICRQVICTCTTDIHLTKEKLS
jgi:organic radical activating enzyme